MPPSVTVIIAAYNAQDTLARAVRSALSEPETAEVIVVDDASGDATCAVAGHLAQADTRVRLMTSRANQGPAAARNRALDAATAEYVAILDSDDVFLPGRLARLLACDGADMVADNIAFVTAENLGGLPDDTWRGMVPTFRPLGTAAFVRGNLRTRGVARGELGFLKPVMSRAFLNRYHLRYDPALRLGEDYDLYVRMLLAGAVLKLTHYPGYAAVVRQTSLSAQHGAAELVQLHDRLASHLSTTGLSPDLVRAMQAHLDEVRRKRDHRLFLDLRRRQGARAAIRYLFGAVNRALPVAGQIARDKLGLSAMAGEAAPASGVRLLLPMDKQASALAR
ncbi:glycosyltransferase family 2 protein [Roseobacter weihaiensis]|uniref:glycosyltransferase family 2 protein n=1 Tax=Roseobacter weihaiensis TaxID=2763262 RepID=UPI001D09E1CE|nr:glycosyltransferase family 2 protein [Roseobacter sp. H9]